MQKGWISDNFKLQQDVKDKENWLDEIKRPPIDWAEELWKQHRYLFMTPQEKLATLFTPLREWGKTAAATLTSPFYERAGAPAVKTWTPEEVMPSGGLREEYEKWEAPWGVKGATELGAELPLWMALPASATARAARAALKVPEAAPMAEKVFTEAGRAALLPIEIGEKALAAGLKYGIGVPIKYGVAKTQQVIRIAFEKALDTGLDFWLARQGIRGEQAPLLIRKFLEVNNRQFFTIAQGNVIKRMAARRATTKGATEVVAKQAAADTIKEMEPMLLQAGRDVGAIKPEVPVAPGIMPTKPTVPELPVGITPEPVVETAIPGGVTYARAPEVMSSYTQKVEAHRIAKSKLLISEADKPTPQYRRLAKAMTGKTSMKDMTEAEASSFIAALDRLEFKRGRPPKIPTSAALIPQSLAEKIPLFQEIGALERLRPTRQVFEKIGLGEEVFWDAFEREVLYGEQYMALEKEVSNLARGINTERRRAIFRALENPDEEVLLAPEERDASAWLRRYFDEWADKLKLPAEKRRKNYVTHIFETALEEDLKAKTFDPELIRALDFIVPKTIFNPYLQQRLGRTAGLKEDPFVAALAYGRRALRQFHYEPLIRKIRVYDRNGYLPPVASAYLRRFINRITNRPLAIDREMNQTLREFAKSIEGLPLGKKLAQALTRGNIAGLSAYNYTSFLYFTWLGFKPTSAIRNLSQHTLILAETGPINFVKGMGLRVTAEGRAALKESLVLRSRKQALLPGIDASFASRWMDRTREVALKMFRWADKQNVSDAFLAGYAEARSLKLPRPWAIKRGDEVAADTQYIYTKLGGADWSQSSIGRAMAPLTTWPENWVELMTRWIGGRPSHVYQRYEAETGQKVTEQMPWIMRRKALLLYLALVGAAYAAEHKTPVRASEYTGWTSIEYLMQMARGTLPGLDLPGGIAQVVGGALLGKPNLIKQGWNRVRPDRLMGIIRQFERIAKGEVDWQSLFIYLNPEKEETTIPKRKGVPQGIPQRRGEAPPRR